jgi:hypothetical protein
MPSNWSFLNQRTITLFFYNHLSLFLLKQTVSFLIETWKKRKQLITVEADLVIALDKIILFE